ncbi:MAG TPA: hypothetical protein VGF47_04965 [Solirubrobacteraceae bacterium]|jgi:hypothetical protein
MSIGDTVTTALTPRTAPGSGATHSNPAALRRLALPALALLLIGLLALLCQPAASLAKNAGSACSAAAAQEKTGARACAGRNRKGRAHAKVKGHHAKRHHSTNKKKKSKHGSVAPVAAAVPKPAVCEDGSRPVNEGEGSYTCANGNEPVCKNGAEPALSKDGTKLLCPTGSRNGAEWSEAECEDGSSPEASLGGGFTCEDGSQPRCEDGSRPTASGDGSMLVCLVSGSPPLSSPPAAEEENEGEES